MGKKKKKKKTPFDPDAGEEKPEVEEVGGDGEEAPVKDKKEKKKVVFDEEEGKDDMDMDDIDLESFGTKKKKKKKRGEGLDNLDVKDSLPDNDEAEKGDDGDAM